MKSRLAIALMLSGCLPVTNIVEPLAAQATEEITDLADWSGPFGGLPPVDKATPDIVAAQGKAAVEQFNAELDAIADNQQTPTFSNTVEALDRAGRPLRRLMTILQIFVTTQATEEWRATAAELMPLNDGVLARARSDPRIFSRVAHVYRELPSGVANPEQARLTELTYQAMSFAGAGLDDTSRERLAEIESELASLRARFNRNLNLEAAGQFTFFEDAAQLEGLPPPLVAAAAETAREQGRQGSWAIPNQRPQVFAFQTHVRDRSARQQVWQRWMDRGATDGEYDNRPVTARILALRDEKAQLLGYPTYAHYVLASRMVGTPEKALEVIEANWKAVLKADAARIEDLTQLAKADGIESIQPWDRIYYLEQYKAETFGIDSQEIASYFPLPRVRDAFFAAANDTYGFTFEPLQNVPTVSPDIEVFLARREKEPVAVVYIDIRPRPGKQQGSWAVEYRRVGDTEPGALPVVALHSSPPAGTDGGEPLLPYPYANVLFHEFGHTLHTIASRANYNGTAALTVPWDFVEVPSLLNERWLLTDRTLDRLPHVATGETMPPDLRKGLREALKYEGVFSVNPEFMAMALVDQRMHLANEPPTDVNLFGDEILKAYDFPDSADPMMQPTAAVHMWTVQYAANLYTYLWSDILAADLAEVFLKAEDGFHDRTVGNLYFETVLSRGNVVPIDQAYRDFHGRAPDEEALIRRFGLETQ